MKKVFLLLLFLLMASSNYAQEREILISETFAQYNVGSKIAIAANAAGNYWWTTWSNSPGSTEDGIVATYNGNKCGHLTFGNDQVLLLGDEENGNYDLEFDILVPQSKNGYFNILHHFAGSNSTWAMQCYLHMTNDGHNSTSAPGHGTVHAGSNGIADVPCVYDAWMHFRLNVNTDTDVASYYYTAPGSNEILMCTWQWSLDSFGENTVGRTLSAMDFYPPDSGDSEFYLDNFSFTRIGGATAPHFVITPNAINQTLNEDDMTTTTINLNNTGNSIGDWTGWIDFGQSEGGTAVNDIYYDLELEDGTNLSGVSLNIDSPTLVEVGAMFPGSAYAGSAMGTQLISAQYPFFEWIDADQNPLGIGVEPNTPVTFRVYGQGLNGQPGELLAEKVIPYDEIVLSDWTVATFDEPVVLSGFNVWVTCEFTQQVEGGFPFAFDGGEAAEFGDYYRTNGGGAFRKCSEVFSHDYGNFHVRATFQGNPVSGTWATINNTHGSILGGNSEVITLSLNSIGMSQGSYYSNIIIETNDSSHPHIEIPLTLNVESSVTNYTITATTNPNNGGTVSGAGSYSSGSTCTLRAYPNNGYSFVKWTKNGTQVSTNPNYSFTVTSNASYVAHFQQNTTNYIITVSANPTNGGNVTGGGTFSSGSTRTVTATPNANYTFANWTENDNVVSTNASYTFTLNANRNLVANFTYSPQNYTITVSANPTNGGNVAGGGTYSSGSTRTVTATPNANYTFANWTENGSVVSTNASYTFTLNANRNLVANFTYSPQNYTITVSANPPNGGNVAGGGTFSSGSTRTVTATPNTNYTFSNWTENGNVVSTNASYTFTLNANRNLVANFTANAAPTYTITANAEPSNGGSITGAGTYSEGETCVLLATPNENYIFENWTRNGNEVSRDPRYEFPVNRDLTFVAHFTQDNSHFTITAMADPIEGGSVSGGGTYESGATCALNAIAAEGYEFINWTSNGIQVSTEPSFSVTVTSNAVYVAHFRRSVNHYTITVNVEPTSAGSVIGAGTFEEGATCTLIPMPNPTYSFVCWTENGIIVSTDNPYSFVVNQNRNLVAVFHQELFSTITASAGPNGIITPDGEVMVLPGNDKTFNFIPDDGCSVNKVIVDGVDRGALPSYTFRNVNENHSIHVQFSGLGVDDNIITNLKVYPNPAQDKINIESPNMKHVAVFNLLGVQIERKDVNDDYATISTNELPQGTYILKVEYLDGSVGYSRFMVAK